MWKRSRRLWSVSRSKRLARNERHRSAWKCERRSCEAATRETRAYHFPTTIQAAHTKSNVFFETPLSKWVRRQSVCKHAATVTERMPDSHIHHAAVRCADCGRHLRWIPKPETIERQRLNAFRLARLAMCDRLNSWERGFVRDVSKRRKLSPKQQAIIDRLVRQYAS